MVKCGPRDEKLIQNIVASAERYGVNGAIHYAHVGCRQSADLIKLLKDALSWINVPVLVLNCDIIDCTVTPEEETSRKLAQFFELLEEH
jgi:hypothetical protein